MSFYSKKCRGLAVGLATRTGHLVQMQTTNGLLGLKGLLQHRIFRVSNPSLHRFHFLPVTLTRAAELGERLCSSTPVTLVSKPFQSYYRKAREGRALQLDASVFADSVAALRLYIACGIPQTPFLGDTPATEPGNPCSQWCQSHCRA
jgi:hypothetical protein